MNVELYRFEFTKKQLSTLTEDEQVFFVKLGELLNNIQIIQKCIIYSLSNKPANDIELYAQQTTMAMFFTKLLAGIAYEGWEFIRKIYFGKKISTKYADKLPIESKRALDELKNYFGKNNAINLIRNKYAFHNDADAISNFLKSINEQEMFEFFASRKSGNNYYHFSDIIINMSFQDALHCNDIKEAIIKAQNEIISVCKFIYDFSSGLIAIITRDINIELKEDVHLTAKSVDEIMLPYFSTSFNNKNANG